MALILRGRRLSGLSLSAMATFVDFGRWLSGHGMELGHEDFLSRRLGRASQIGRAVYDVGASQGSAAVPGACIRPNTSSNEEQPQAYGCRAG